MSGRKETKAGSKFIIQQEIRRARPLYEDDDDDDDDGHDDDDDDQDDDKIKGVQKKARKLINGNVQRPHCASDNNICHIFTKDKYFSKNFKNKFKSKLIMCVHIFTKDKNLKGICFPQVTVTVKKRLTHIVLLITISTIFSQKMKNMICQ